MARERDYAFEALAEVTNSDWTANRGELNAALGSIREQTDIEDSYLLADAIHNHAKWYKEVMGPDVLMTPTALAKHWLRVSQLALERKKPSVQGTNRAVVTDGECKCGGDRFVVVQTRKEGDGPVEEMAPCPDCNPVTINFYRTNGQRVSTPDPDQVRRMMQA